jgi:DnaJ-class molecular chaperone
VSDQTATDDTPREPLPCPPCRGTGQVISNLGGSPSTVTCPWCEGSGVFNPEHDAQAARRGAPDAPGDAAV